MHSSTFRAATSRRGALRRVITCGVLTLSLLLIASSVVEAQTYSISYSESSDRSAAQDLDGATVSGDIYAFTTPDTNVDRVLFWIDNVAMTGTPDKTENNAPYDLGGGSVASANPFDTEDEDDGEHTLSVRLEMNNGSTVEVTATFTISNNAPPPPELAFDPQVASTVLGEDEQDSLSVDLDTNDGSTATPSISDNASWLTATLVGTTTPASVDLDFDSTGLAPGTYNATVTAEATGYPDRALPVTLTVTGAGGSIYSVRVSTSSDRSSHVNLDGESVTGDIYVFTGPDTEVDRVIFYLDDPGQTGSPHRTENGAPYDYNGGGGGGTAAPFDTTELPDGLHTITAELDFFDGGGETIHATFRIANTTPVLEFSPGSIGLTLGENETESTSVDLDTSDGAVGSYTLTSTESWLSVATSTGDTPATFDVDVDTTGLAFGTYSGEIQASAPGYEDATLTVNLEVIPVSLILAPTNLSFDFEPDESGSQNISLSTSNGEEADYTAETDAGWLSVSPGTGTSPDTLTVTADAAGLGDGTYNGTVTVTAPGFDPATTDVTLFVTDSAYKILVSTNADRSGATPLSDAVVVDDIYVFTGPDTDVDRVIFYLNDPTQSDSPHRTENSPPYDYNGSGAGSNAAPWDTTDLADGLHTVTAELDFFGGGSEVIHATFRVANTTPALTFAPGMVDFVLGADETASGTSDLETTDGTAAEYTLTSNQSWLTVDVSTGTTPATVIVEVDSTGLGFGTYTGEIEATATGYDSATLIVDLEVIPVSLTLDRSSLSFDFDPDESGS